MKKKTNKITKKVKSTKSNVSKKTNKPNLSEKLFLGLGLVLLALIVVIISINMNNDKSKTEDKIDLTQIGDAQLGDTVNVIIETNLGDIEVELNNEDAPITVANFLKYVKSNFYSKTIYHRVIDGFMVQGGGFSENGIQKKTFAPIKLESNNGLKNKKYTIAMARTSIEDSATSQFFINTKDNGFLDYKQTNPGYAVFGKVVSGFEVVDKIEKVQTGFNQNGMKDWPVQNVVIESVKIKTNK